MGFDSIRFLLQQLKSLANRGIKIAFDEDTHWGKMHYQISQIPITNPLSKHTNSSCIMDKGTKSLCTRNKLWCSSRARHGSTDAFASIAASNTVMSVFYIFVHVNIACTQCCMHVSVHYHLESVAVPHSVQHSLLCKLNQYKVVTKFSRSSCHDLQLFKTNVAWLTHISAYHYFQANVGCQIGDGEGAEEGYERAVLWILWLHPLLKINLLGLWWPLLHCYMNAIWGHHWTSHVTMEDSRFWSRFFPTTRKILLKKDYNSSQLTIQLIALNKRMLIKTYNTRATVQRTRQTGDESPQEKFCPLPGPIPIAWSWEFNWAYSKTSPDANQSS